MPGRCAQRRRTGPVFAMSRAVNPAGSSAAGTALFSASRRGSSARSSRAHSVQPRTCASTRASAIRVTDETCRIISVSPGRYIIDHFASGSGRIWNLTTLLVVPFPPSM